jgi:hypothetical protein
MFSKSTKILAMALALMLSSNVMAQQSSQAPAQKKAAAKKAADKKAADAKKAEKLALEQKAAEEARIAGDVAAEKADDEKAVIKKEETSSTDSAYKRFLSVVSLSYHGEYYMMRRLPDSPTEPTAEQKKLQDFHIMHNPTIVIRPLTNWKILATSELKYSDSTANSPSQTYINRHYRSLFLLTRENLFTEKVDGFRMDASLGRRVFDAHFGSSYGNSRANVSLSKKFGEHSSSLLVQYLLNDPKKGKKAPTTWRHSLELIPSFTYQITDKLSWLFNDDIVINRTGWGDPLPGQKEWTVSHEMNIAYLNYQINDQHAPYLQLKYNHVEGYRKSDPANGLPTPAMEHTNNYEYYVGHAWPFTPKTTVTFEVGGELFVGKDGRDFFSEKLKYPEFAVYLDLSL